MLESVKRMNRLFPIQGRSRIPINSKEIVSRVLLRLIKTESRAKIMRHKTFSALVSALLLSTFLISSAFAQDGANKPQAKESTQKTDQGKTDKPEGKQTAAKPDLKNLNVD